VSWVAMFCETSWGSLRFLLWYMNSESAPSPRLSGRLFWRRDLPGAPLETLCLRFSVCRGFALYCEPKSETKSYAKSVTVY
jgi:hypothetical protein